MKKIIWAILLLGFLTTSCRKDDVDIDITNTPIDEVDHRFKQDVYGQVVDEVGLPLGEVDVEMEQALTVTDENGFFLFKDVSVGNFGVHISASKAGKTLADPGYLFGGYRIYAEEDSRKFVKIVLMKASSIESFSASTGAEVVLPDGSTLNFPEDAFTENGNPYDGTVHVFGRWIDPSGSNMLELAPSDLRARRADDEIMILRSYGMMGIELMSDLGTELEITKGKEVELSMVVPDEFLSEAPMALPLWHFDEDEGLWIEEGSATLDGNTYKGNVTHFSWWNCDYPYPLVNLCVHVIPDNGSFDGYLVVIENLDGFGSASGYTNDRGLVCGLVPEGDLLQIFIYGHCGNLIHTQEIGPYTDDDDELINVTVPLGVTINLNGSIEECTTGNPVSGSYVYFKYDGNVSVTLSDNAGMYNHTLSDCDDVDELNITAIDLTSGTGGSATLFNVSSGSYTENISLCDEEVEIFFVSLPFGEIAFDKCIARMKPHETIILAGEGSNGGELLGINGFATGDHSGSYLGSFGAINGSDISINVEKYEDVDGVVKGSFSGTNADGDAVLGWFTARRVE